MKTADRASGWQVPVLALTIVLLAPLTEELLFRGALLRSLLRKVSPTVAVLTAVVFGLVHALGDPSVGTVIALPAIILLGIVSGYQAARPATCRRSILLHVGFNALSVVFLFTYAFTEASGRAGPLKSGADGADGESGLELGGSRCSVHAVRRRR